MTLDETIRLIRARIPELSDDLVERIRITLSDETPSLPAIAAIVTKIEMRMVALETGTPQHLN